MAAQIEMNTLKAGNITELKGALDRYEKVLHGRWRLQARGAPQDHAQGGVHGGECGDEHSDAEPWNFDKD